jgi:long-chain acyl-CoA synthetase
MTQVPGSPEPTIRWGSNVVRTTVRGHEVLAYQDRPHRITAVLDEAQRWAERPFIHYGERTVTFAEHDRMVRSFAVSLRAWGVKPSDRVGVFAANSPEWVGMFFAILSIGAVVVPCNGWWSAAELEHACDVVTPTVLVCDRRHAERAPQHLEVVLIDDIARQPAATAPSRQDEAVDTDEDDTAIILFTAGTTSFPKGALLSHRALVSNLQTLLTVAKKLPQQVSDDAPASVTLVGLPLFHIGAIQLILVPMMTGSQIVFLDGRFDPSDVLRQMDRRHVTMFSGVPTMMERLLASDEIKKRDTGALRTVVLGGAPVDDRLLERVRAAFPGTSRGVGQTYGLTEAGGVVSTGVGSRLQEHRGSSGKLAPVVEARIDHPDAEGIGTIMVRSPAAMDGYLGSDGAQPIDADGWLDTGDLGWLDADQYLYITGRAKDVIIRGGENISAARVEAVLLTHPQVVEAAVVGLPDREWGQVVGAAVRLRSPSESREPGIAAFAAKHLASFAVPTRWWLCSQPLPTNDAGKVLKTQIISQWPDGDEVVDSTSVALRASDPGQPSAMRRRPQ